MKKLFKAKKIFFFLAAAILLTIPFTSHAQQPTSNKQPALAAVAPFGEALFDVHGDIGSVTAEKRAKIISENIANLSKDAFFKPEFLKIEPTHESANIIYKKDIIAGITAQQAKTAQKSQIELANDYLLIIKDAVQKERETHLKILRIEEIALALLIILLTFMCIKGLNIFLNYFNNKLLRKKDQDGISKEVQLTFKAIKILRMILVLAIIAVSVIVLLWLFPATRWFAESFLSYIEKPLMSAMTSVWHYMPNLIEIIVLIVLFRLVERLLFFAAKKIEAGSLELKNFDRDWAMPTFQIVRVLTIVFMFILIFPLLPKSDSSIFKGISVFIGVLISLGSTSLISNIVSGLVITYMRPFNVGDRIKMGEHVGDVIEKNSLVTRIKTTKNEIITIPNSKIMTADTTNYTRSATKYGLILHSDVTIGYDTDWKKVHALLIEAAAKTENALKEPKPFVNQTALDPFYVKYEINFYISDASKMSAVYSDIYKNIQDVFNREKIELLSPMFNRNINETLEKDKKN